MRPIRLTTIGKIIWMVIFLIFVLIVAYIVSFFKKEDPIKVDNPQVIDSEKVIDYTETKVYTYDFSSDDEIEATNDTITIKDSGTYKLVGKNNKYKIVVDSKNSIIKFVLSNFTTNQVDKLIDIKNANKVIFELEDNSKNWIISDELETEASAKSVIISSNSNIEFIGTGNLVVESVGTFIKSNANVDFKNSTIEINNINKAIDIKGNFKLENGTIYILASESGLKSDGNINIESGTFVIRCPKSAIKNDGIFIINSGKVFIASGDVIQKPNANSLQKTLILNFKDPRKQIFIMHDTSQIVLAYAGSIEYSHILYSDEFKAESYVLYGNGKLAGTQTYGLYKVEDSEESWQLTAPNLENDRFLVTELVNIYDDVVKK